MLRSDNGILFAVGMSKSGKTRLLKSELTEWLDDGGRAIVIDILDDWPGDDMEWDGNMASANTMDACRKLIRSGWQCVILKPGKPVFTPFQTTKPGAPMVEHCSDLVLTESSKERPIALVISEAHLQIAQKGSLGDQTWHLLTAYRHYGAAVLLDSQRPVAVKMEARSQVTKLYLCAMASNADMDWVRDVGGSELVTAVAQCARNFSDGVSGWHVCIDPRAPMPPFTLERL